MKISAEIFLEKNHSYIPGPGRLDRLKAAADWVRCQGRPGHGHESSLGLGPDR